MPYIRAAARWYYSAGATTLSHDRFPALVCRGLMSSGIADRFVTDCIPRCQGSCSDVVTASNQQQQQHNSNSWAAPAIMLEQLDITHRKHLRRILKIHWPKGTISNDELYKRCSTNKLSDRVCKYRWTMFGHVLRSDMTTPAFLSLKFALSNTKKSRKGRHQSNIFNLLIADLKSRNISLKNVDELLELSKLAFCRASWRRLFSRKF